jgi:hypothetical protein
MVYRSKTYQACTTWLTAAATLLAGLPSWQCFCAASAAECSAPAGIAKPAPCCCCGGCHSPGHPGGTCCQAAVSASTNPNPKIRLSALGRAEPASWAAYLSHRIEPIQCKGGLVPSRHLGLVSPQPDRKQLVGSAAVLCQALVAGLSATSSAAHLSPTHSHSPPANLVCLLKHLLI